MELKTFEAFTMKDALKAVKGHFGQDAVILNTREKKIEGAQGKIYEITAASNSEAASREGAKSISQGVPAMRENLVEMFDYFRSLERTLKSMNDELAKKSDLFRIDAGLHELRTIVFEELTRKSGGISGNVPDSMLAVFQRLKLMGVDEGELSRLLEHIRALPAGKPETPEYYQAQAIRWMMKRLKVAPQWNPAQGERVVHTLVGPAGSGKTSTIARIASYYQQKHQQRLLVLSFDNKRLAAREQLRIMSKVLGFQFEAIEDPANFREALSKNNNWDLCLVDTSAACPRVKDDLEDLLTLRDFDISVYFHIVLSITEKESQLDRMVRGFSPLGIQSIIFNRLDESWSYGEIFNLSIRWGLPLSFFGVGYRIPEDLERASRERVIERIFGI